MSAVSGPVAAFPGSASSVVHSPCIPPGSLNQVPALISWGKGGNVTSARQQVTLCDPVWHVSSRSGEVSSRTAIFVYFTLLLPHSRFQQLRARP